MSPSHVGKLAVVTPIVAHDMYLIITQGNLLVVTAVVAHDTYLDSDTCQLLVVTWKRK